MAAFRSATFNFLFFGFTAVFGIVCLPFLLGRWRSNMFVARIWSLSVLALLRLTVGIDHRITGKDNIPKGAAIFAIKHQSAWETIAFNSILDNAAYVLKKELFSIPIFGWFVRRANMIGVDRDAGAKALRHLLRSAESRIAEGRSLIVFPEGTRTAPGTEKPYLPGIVALYRAFDLPVVPVALNSGLFWGRRSFVKQAGTITVAFLDPIPPGLDRAAFMRELESRIENASRDLATAQPEMT